MNFTTQQHTAFKCVNWKVSSNHRLSKSAFIFPPFSFFCVWAFIHDLKRPQKRKRQYIPRRRISFSVTLSHFTIAWRSTEMKHPSTGFSAHAPKESFFFHECWRPRSTGKMTGGPFSNILRLSQEKVRERGGKCGASDTKGIFLKIYVMSLDLEVIFLCLNPVLEEEREGRRVKICRKKARVRNLAMADVFPYMTFGEKVLFCTQRFV